MDEAFYCTAFLIAVCFKLYRGNWELWQFDKLTDEGKGFCCIL